MSDYDRVTTYITQGTCLYLAPLESAGEDRLCSNLGGQGTVAGLLRDTGGLKSAC